MIYIYKKWHLGSRGQRTGRYYAFRYTYDYVLGKSLGHYTNLEAPNDVKLLIITDSFGKCVTPYLMMDFSEIRYIFDGDVSELTPEYIQTYKPDVVIMMCYADVLLEEKKGAAFQFQEFQE